MMGLGLWRYPKRSSIFLALVAVCFMPFYAAFFDVADLLVRKTSLVGFNMRFEELRAVWAEVSKSPFHLLFGSGWGATFESPAVAGVRVNFTHSLLSSTLLKMGIIGLALVILYIGGLSKILWQQLYQKPVLVLALAGPLFIDVFLYASFKSLDFGLILLLIATLQVNHENQDK